ncbi:MAG: MFS transporter, partial [Micrococcales bacterium 73-13]
MTSDMAGRHGETTGRPFAAEAAGNEDPPPPVKGLRRLMVWIVPANLGIFMVWGAVPTILLPEQITQLFGETDKVANLALVTTIGAFCAMVAQPIAGQISDRTRARLGRRAPWILLGAFAGALALVGLAFASTLVGVIIAWSLVQIAFNIAQGPLSAILPDRVPLQRRGTFAALSGIGLMLGALGGQILGSLFLGGLTAGYVLFAAAALVMLTLFVAFNPDRSSTPMRPPPFDLPRFLRTFWVDPVRHPDFFWAFTGRLLLYTAYFAVTGYQYYLLTDYFRIAEPGSVIPLLGIVSLIGIVGSIVVSGPLSDRIGRRKPFVLASGLVIGLGFLVPWIWPDLTAWMVTAFLAGLGFGIFQSVDTAL